MLPATPGGGKKTAILRDGPRTVPGPLTFLRGTGEGEAAAALLVAALDAMRVTCSWVREGKARAMSFALMLLPPEFGDRGLLVGGVNGMTEGVILATFEYEPLGKGLVCLGTAGGGSPAAAPPIP